VPATKEAFDESALKAAKIARGDGTNHTLTIMVAGNAPCYHHYRDGKLQEPASPTTPALAASGPSPDAKPEKKSDRID
jgi:hypothetical protein